MRYPFRSDHQVSLLLAVGARELHDWEQVESRCRDLLVDQLATNRKGDPLVFQLLGESQVGQRKINEAIASYGLAIQQCEPFRGEFEIRLGTLFGEAGNHPQAAVRAVKPAEMYQPTPMPDRVILTWAGDPKTTQAVTWRTSVEVKDGYAELAIAGGGPDFAVLSEEYHATSTALKTDINTAHFHSVQFKGLSRALFLHLFW